MGITANLFFTTTDPENCLDYRIRPSEVQQSAQEARWNDLRDFLVEKLQSLAGYSISSWLQGSYKFGTQIRPAKPTQEFDIDLGIYYRWPGDPTEGKYLPSELKSLVQDSLESYAGNDENDAEEVTDPKERCSRIRFKDSFHIDVPTYHLDAGRDARTLATETNSWEVSDPKSIYIWWKEKFDDATRPRARRLVRYLKMWAALKFEDTKRPSSIMLTVLLAEALASLDTTRLAGDDEFLHACSAAILNTLRSSQTVKNPIDSTENLNRLNADSSADLVNKLDTLVSTAARAVAATSKADSAEIWSEIFEHFFPMTDEIATDSKAGAIVVMAFDPQVDIQIKNGHRTTLVQNAVSGIPKGCELTFSLANAFQLPRGAQVSWTVRNSGEAEAANDLGHTRLGFSTVETSAYKGAHYMDVTIRLNGRTIGRRRVPVKITGLGLPLRNPPRPAYAGRKFVRNSN
jgi:hypothetical protein